MQGINRTSVELKPIVMMSILFWLSGINRTSVELKHIDILGS